MNYQESLELLQQVCNDLLNRQMDRSIAFAAKPKIEEALVAFNKCIQEARQVPDLEQDVEEARGTIGDLQDNITELRLELDGYKSVHLAAEHGKAFEEAIPLKVDEVPMGHGWRKNTGEQPVDDDVVVDIMLADGGTGTDVAEVWDWSNDLEDFGRIDYWRPSESAQCNEHSND